MNAAPRRARWALSFADLVLLLLAFFVLLQASGDRSAAMIANVGAQFGGAPLVRPVELRAAALFVPGEAMLTPDGAARIAAAVRRLGVSGAALDVQSRGTDPAGNRFDDWDLAAARLGAVARAIRAHGLADDRLVIRGLDQRDGQGGKGQARTTGQVILIAPGRGPAADE